MTDVLIVGFPRSGNTWVARLIADTLDSPLVGLPDKGAVPIGLEGLNRTGGYTVRQLHLVPRSDDDYECAIPGPYTFAVNKWQDEKVILVMRDPRDVAVSCMHYWEIPTLERAIEAIANRLWPVAVPFAWADYNREWLQFPVAIARYELFLEDTEKELTGILSYLNLKPANDIVGVIERQSFQVRRKEFETMNEQHQHYHPYGTGIQLKMLRKGEAGDWRNYFTRSDGQLFHRYFFEAMQEFGYERDPGWFQHLPEQAVDSQIEPR